MRKSLGILSLCAIALGGCGGLGGLGGLGQEPPSAHPVQPSLFQRAFGTQAAPTEPAPAVPMGVAIQCPATSVRPGTEVLQTFDKGKTGDPLALRWQGSITFSERECHATDTQVSFAVGVAGRVLLGPAGAAGSYQVPVRIAIMRGGETTLFSKLVQVSVSVPAGQPAQSFTHVEQNIVIPRDSRQTLSDVQIFVGFDPKPEPKKKAAKKK